MTPEEANEIMKNWGNGQDYDDETFNEANEKHNIPQDIGPERFKKLNINKKGVDEE